MPTLNEPIRRPPTISNRVCPPIHIRLTETTARKMTKTMSLEMEKSLPKMIQKPSEVNIAVEILGNFEKTVVHSEVMSLIPMAKTKATDVEIKEATPILQPEDTAIIKSTKYIHGEEKTSGILSHTIKGFAQGGARPLKAAD
jgi:hypothetical protein